MTDANNCPSCGVATSSDAKFCEFCGVTLQPRSASVGVSLPPTQQGTIDRALGISPRSEEPSSGAMLQGRAGLTMTRYQEGYHYSEIIHGLGNLIQVLAYVAGGLLALIGFLGMLGLAQDNPFGSLAVAGGLSTFITGLLIGAIGYIHGILIKALGYFLKAQCDCAVNSSHFLTDDQRAEVMSLLE